jgi:uncharacterized protein
MRTQSGKAATKSEARSSKLIQTHLIRCHSAPSPFPSPPTWGRGRGEGDPPNVKGIDAFVSVQRSLTHVVVLLLVMVVCLSACAGKSATSQFYVLSSLPQPSLSAAEGTVIGVFPVSMPEYLDRPQIVTRVSENELKLDEFSRWAEPLKDSFTRALVQNLSSLLNTAKVVKTTESTGFPMALQVGVEVVQFDGTLGGDVVLIAKWGLFEAGGKKLLHGKRSAFKELTGAATYEALVVAQSKAVAALSREIADAIRNRR